MTVVRGFDVDGTVFLANRLFGWSGVDTRVKPGHDGDLMERGWGVAQGGFVYLMTNRPNGVLYVGVTSDLIRRVWEHREGVMVGGFTERYGLKVLVWFEQHESVVGAIGREKALKAWPRAWKVRLILERNVGWADLYPSII